ncbi:MAG TPA: ABC transporter permease [Gemmatimonadales bacterium]|nr:ABC transporter permease [Gemmatimonadales bacterium]
MSQPVPAPAVDAAETPAAAEPPGPSTLREVARDLWDYRELLYQLTLRDIRIRYKQAIMGFAWAVFMPMFVIGAGVLVRYAMAQFAGRTLAADAVAGIAVKALPWAFFVGAIGFATTSLVGNANLVSKVYFPREVLPLSAVLAQAFDSAIGTLALLVLLSLLGVDLGLTALWAPLLAGMLLAFTAGAALFLGAANLFFRDVKYIVQVLLTFGIFVTPVFFEPAMFGPSGAQLMMLNPLAPILEGLRLAVVAGHDLLAPLQAVGRGGLEVVAWSPWYLLYAGAWALLGLFGSAALFHRLEFVFAEYV